MLERDFLDDQDFMTDEQLQEAQLKQAIGELLKRRTIQK
jgi:hypothetical protein